MLYVPLSLSDWPFDCCYENPEECPFPSVTFVSNDFLFLFLESQLQNENYAGMRGQAPDGG